MKPSKNIHRLYAGADMTQVADLSFVDGCALLVELLGEAKILEVAKMSIYPTNFKWSATNPTPLSPIITLCDYSLITAQNQAQEFWRGVIKMVTGKVL